MKNNTDYLASNKDIRIVNKFNTASLYFFLCTILFAACFMFLRSENTSVANVSIAISVVCLILGCIKASKKVSQYTYLPTDSRVKMHTLYFNMNASNELIHFLKLHDMELLKRLEPLKSGGVLVKLYLSDDNAFSLLKSFQYDEYIYRTLYQDESFSSEECEQIKEILKIR